MSFSLEKEAGHFQGCVGIRVTAATEMCVRTLIGNGSGWFATQEQKFQCQEKVVSPQSTTLKLDWTDGSHSTADAQKDTFLYQAQLSLVWTWSIKLHVYMLESSLSIYIWRYVYVHMYVVYVCGIYICSYIERASLLTYIYNFWKSHPIPTILCEMTWKKMNLKQANFQTGN